MVSFWQRLGYCWVRGGVGCYNYIQKSCTYWHFWRHGNSNVDIYFRHYSSLIYYLSWHTIYLKHKILNISVFSYKSHLISLTWSIHVFLIYYLNYSYWQERWVLQKLFVHRQRNNFVYLYFNTFTWSKNIAEFMPPLIFYFCCL